MQNKILDVPTLRFLFLRRLLIYGKLLFLFRILRELQKIYGNEELYEIVTFIFKYTYKQRALYFMHIVYRII